MLNVQNSREKIFITKRNKKLTHVEDYSDCIFHVSSFQKFYSTLKDLDENKMN